MKKINMGDFGHENTLSMFLAAQFTSKKATLNTTSLIKQFPNYFQDIRIARQFYVDILCLYVNIYHRLGEDMIKDKRTIPSIVTLDERMGFFIGTCGPIIEEHSNEFPFLQSISLQFLMDTFKEFHNWSRQYEIIYDPKNKLSIKFNSDQIVGFSFIGQNTLIINFIAKEVKALSIKEKDLDMFIFYLSDLINRYSSDSILKVFLDDYLSCDPAIRRLIDEERKA